MVSDRLQRLYRGAVLALGTLLALPSLATTESRLHQQVREYVSQQSQSQRLPNDRVEITLNKLDSRLQLSTCANAPQLSTRRPLTPGNFSIKAFCPGPKRWTVYLSGTLEIFRQVVVTNKSLPRRFALTPQFLKLEEHPVSTLRAGYFTDPVALQGHITRRHLGARQVIQSFQLDPPLLVRAGEQVTIRAGTKGVVVESKGEALEDGQLHQQISVRNLKSTRTVKAYVVAKGIVEAR